MLQTSSLKLRKKLLGLICFLVLTPIIFSSPLENVLTNSWVYDYIDYLRTYGLIKTVPASSKPWTRKEAALLIREALDYPEIPKSAETFLYRLSREFYDELEVLGYEPPARWNPLIRFKLFELNSSDGPEINFDLLSRLGADTSNQTAMIGAVIKTGYDDRIAIYDRFEVTFYNESIFDMHDSAGVHVPGTRVKSGRNFVTFLNENAYFSFKIPWLILELGRDKLSFGPGKRPSVMLSDSAPALDMIQIKGDYRNFKLLMFTAALSRWGERQRFVSGQRFELSLFSRLRLGGAMFVVHSPDSSQTKSFYGYLNPLIPIYSEVANTNHDDNFLVGWDGVFYLLRSQVYGQLFLDNWESKPERVEKIPNAYGLKLGFYTVPLAWVDFCAEYNKVTHYTYYHRIFHIAYTQYGVPLGNPLGPDADESYLRINFYPVKWFFPSAQFSYTRRGDRNRGDYMNKTWLGEGISPISKTFPSGVVEKTLSLGPEITFQPLPDLRIFTSGQYYKITNPGGIDTLPANSGFSASIRIEYRY